MDHTEVSFTKGKPIVFWDRQNAREAVELVYGEKAIRQIYGTRLGQILSEALFSQAAVSKLYGAYQSSKLSTKKIQPFIEEFKIPMEEYEETSYSSFNDFFIRKFKPGVRPFVSASSDFPAFAEARYFAYESITPDLRIPVKGKDLSAEGLLGSEEKAQIFKGGPLLLARLCPVDYHRFHFPDDGNVLESYRLHGKLHSVNPMALKYKSDIFITNERQVTVLQTQNFGKIAYIEVGATGVGKIIQTHPDQEFKRGEEKGYFLFGGSTVIVLGERGRWKPDSDLIERTRRGQETLIRLGEKIAARPSEL